MHDSSIMFGKFQFFCFAIFLKGGRYYNELSHFCQFTPVSLKMSPFDHDIFHFRVKLSMDHFLVRLPFSQTDLKELDTSHVRMSLKTKLTFQRIRRGK